MLAALLLLAQALPVPAARPSPAPPATGQDIVVRGQRSEAALAACIARRCDPREEIRLSIAHAEARFAAGGYADARRTLARAIARHRGAAARHPRHVAALYEASATVNRHHGDVESYRRGVTGQARTLRENLPADDPDVLLVTIRLADYRTRTGNLREAAALYAQAARRYAAIGQPRLAAFASLREANVALATRDLARVDRLLAGVTASPAGGDAGVMRGHAIIAARAAAARGDARAIDTLIGSLRADSAAATPVLLEEGRISPRAGDGRLRRDDAVRPVAPPGRRSWVDIGFLVTADGTVADAEILRGSDFQGWAEAEVARIARRRYAPIALPPDQPGVYRIERLTLRNDIVPTTGSMVRRATGASRVEALDMTRDRPAG